MVVQRRPRTTACTSVRAAASAGTLAAALLAGCSGGFPADPDGTLEEVTGGVLRVGISENPPWTETGPGEPTGLEPALVEGFAETVDAEVEWTTGGEEDLVGRLERDELDLVVGGLTAKSPWSAQAALTYPYTTTPGRDGTPVAHVMAAPMGENAFLVALESYLLEHQDAQP
jgi:polar amino acid transport system substrate-binding protein